MKRVIVIALICAAFFLAFHRPASAMVEFCPAHLDYARVGPDNAGDQPGALYGFNLSALGTRTLAQTTLAFDTSAGWFTVDVPAVTLDAKERHYHSATVSFMRRDYVSPAMYVRFPQDVTINHAWVYSASAQDDGPFGWQTKGNVACDPPAVESPQQAKRALYRSSETFYTLADADGDKLSQVPRAGSLVIPAVSSKPLESAACAEPFSVPVVKIQAVPRYPEVARDQNAGEGTVSVQVALSGDGSLLDAWVWGPSGNTAFDEAAVRAARQSTYSGARAYCRDVPGRYFFRVTFAPT